MANSVDSDQTAPLGAVCSGSKLFTSILNSSVMLGNYLQQTTFSGFFFLALQGFSLASAIGHSPKIVPDVHDFAVQFGQFVETIFRNTRCTVMHSDAIVFLL